MLTVTATEMQNNFGKYLQLLQKNEEIRITKNGEEVARMISRDKTVSYLTDELTGVLKNDYDYDKMCEEKARHYAGLD